MILLGAIGYFVFTQNPPENQNGQNVVNQSVVDCRNNYDCLYEQISKGSSAKVVITEKIESLSLEEKSEVRIEPFNDQYRVLMTVLELKKLEKAQPTTKSIVGSISESCPQMVNNLSLIELASASCIVNTAEEARTLANPKHRLCQAGVRRGRFFYQGDIWD